MVSSELNSLSLNILTYHRTAWKNSGLWHVGNKSYLYTLYSFCVFIIYYICYPSAMAIQLAYTTTLKEIIQIILILPTAYTPVKGFSIFIYRKKFVELFEIIRNMDRMIRTEEQQDKIKKAIKESTRLVNILRCVYYSTGIISFLVALLSSDRRLVWVSWFPYDYTKTATSYYLTMIFQFIGTGLLSYLCTSLDVYPSACYKLLSAHLDCLGDRLQKLGNRQIYEQEMIDVGISKLEIDRTNWKRKFEIDLNECIIYHNYCIKCSEYLNDLLSMPFLIQFAFSGIVFCSSEFQLSVLHPINDFTEFCFIIMYIASMTYQISIPSFFGSLVLSKSETLLSHMFSSNWTDQSAEFKSSMIIFCERVKRPITPFAGGLFAIGLPTFVSIMRTAYSLLAFLKNIDSKF